MESLLWKYKDVFGWSYNYLQGIPPSHCSTLDWTGYNDIAFPIKLVLDKFELCSCGQTRFQQTLDWRIYCYGGGSNLAFAHCGDTQENW
jgi:hypothetical protein